MSNIFDVVGNSSSPYMSCNKSHSKRPPIYTYNLLKIDTFNLIKICLKKVLFIMPNLEISQQLFMFYGSKILKNSLDQFYTPITISSFLSSISLKNKKYIDPAAGTGDLLISFTGDIHLWEISKDAIKMAELNYSMNNKIMKITVTIK